MADIKYSPSCFRRGLGVVKGFDVLFLKPDSLCLRLLIRPLLS
jgi:hypothetical protein